MSGNNNNIGEGEKSVEKSFFDVISKKLEGLNSETYSALNHIEEKLYLIDGIFKKESLIKENEGNNIDDSFVNDINIKLSSYRELVNRLDAICERLNKIV